MLKERRKYRDFTEELGLSYGLIGAVIRQAYEDVRGLNEYEALALKGKGLDRNKYYKGLQSSKDACRFFETRRLERFIQYWKLPLDAGYLRRKYKQLRREMGK